MSAVLRVVDEYDHGLQAAWAVVLKPDWANRCILGCIPWPGPHRHAMHADGEICDVVLPESMFKPREMRA